MTYQTNLLRAKVFAKEESRQPNCSSQLRGNKLLAIDNLENSGLGYRIGLTSVAAPACADDVIMISGKSIDL